jgi:hypothetical protein
MIMAPADLLVSTKRLLPSFQGIMGACLAAGLGLSLAGCGSPGSVKGSEAAPVLTRTFVLEGVRGTRPAAGVPGRIDHLAYDPATQRLFVAALENGSLEVLDLRKGTRIRSIGGLKQPQGAVVVPRARLVAVACGGDGMLHLFDCRSLEPVRTLEVGPDADNVRYDAREHAVLVSYGTTNQGAIAVFDARTWNRLRDIRFPSRPESFQLDPGGARLYANLPGGVRAVEDGQLALVDRWEGSVDRLIRMRNRARNFPMALDARRERLFVVSRKPARLMEVDVVRGEVVAESTCVDDSDDLFYDRETRRVLVIGGGFRPDLQEPGTASPASPPGEMGALEVYDVRPKAGIVRVSSVPTAPHARTGLFVPARRCVYVAVPMREGSGPEIREYRLD